MVMIVIISDDGDDDDGGDDGDDGDDVYNVVVGAFYAQHLKSWQSVCSTGTVSCN